MVLISYKIISSKTIWHAIECKTLSFKLYISYLKDCFYINKLIECITALACLYKSSGNFVNVLFYNLFDKLFKKCSHSILSQNLM